MSVKLPDVFYGILECSHSIVTTVYLCVGQLQMHLIISFMEEQMEEEGMLKGVEKLKERKKSGNGGTERKTKDRK